VADRPACRAVRDESRPYRSSSPRPDRSVIRQRGGDRVAGSYRWRNPACPPLLARGGGRWIRTS
jgi:hypothetical protein